MGLFGNTDKPALSRESRIETRTIAQIGFRPAGDGGPYSVGIRFTEPPSTLHELLINDLDGRSHLELRMLERGDTCEVVSVETAPGKWSIRRIRATELHTKQIRLG